MGKIQAFQQESMRSHAHFKTGSSWSLLTDRKLKVNSVWVTDKRQLFFPPQNFAKMLNVTTLVSFLQTTTVNCRDNNVLISSSLQYAKWKCFWSNWKLHTRCTNYLVYWEFFILPVVLVADIAFASQPSVTVLLMPDLSRTSPVSALGPSLTIFFPGPPPSRFIPTGLCLSTPPHFAPGGSFCLSASFDLPVFPFLTEEWDLPFNLSSWDALRTFPAACMCFWWAFAAWGLTGCWFFKVARFSEVEARLSLLLLFWVLSGGGLRSSRGLRRECRW